MVIAVVLSVAGLAATDSERAAATAWFEPGVTARIVVSPTLFRDDGGVASQVFWRAPPAPHSHSYWSSR